MAQGSQFISGDPARARWMRLDTAHLLKRFFFCERALLVSQAAWIPLIARLKRKLEWRAASGRALKLRTPCENAFSNCVFPAACLKKKEPIVAWSSFSLG